MASYNLKDTQDNLVCTACGTQFPTTDRASLNTCFVCDDPRQYTPGSGQSFTTLADIRIAHKNEFQPIADEPRLISITPSPKLGIGQRAILVRTPAGNILWDCVTLIDEATIAEINKLGGLHGIVISHPHYYTTHVEWAKAFNCSVYLAVEDKKWTTMSDEHQVFLSQTETTIKIGDVDTGATAIKLGGHFPGSLVLLFDHHLLIADTLMITPSGLANWDINALGEPRKRPPGVNTFAFMYSIPNMIPLSPDEIINMWEILKGYNFKRCHGAFTHYDVRDDNVKTRVLKSMQIQIKHMGYRDHPFLHSLW